MKDFSYNNLSFTTINNKHTKQIHKVLQQYTFSRKTLRFLDFGCGTGVNIFDFEKFFTDSTLVGIDISKENIDKANQHPIDSLASNGNQIIFEIHDYMDYQTQPFDVIYAESVLHLISTPTDSLYEKISNDLKMDGILVVTMPYECLYNRFLIKLRRLFKLLEGKFFNKMILAAAKIIYPDMPTKALVDRIPYMYIIPARLDSDHFRQYLEDKFHLTTLKVEKLSSPSIAKPKHNLIVFKKNLRQN